MEEMNRMIQELNNDKEIECRVDKDREKLRKKLIAMYIDVDPSFSVIYDKYLELKTDSNRFYGSSNYMTTNTLEYIINTIARNDGLKINLV